MAFDTNTRNRLAKFVAEARRVLTEEFSEQLQSLYGISATGGIAPLERLIHLDAEGLELAATLRQRIAYLTSSSPAAGNATKPAIDRLTREQAFTVLNRLAAIRMAEKRGLIVESVGQQYQSKGFKVFESVAGSAIGDTYDRYRCYLFCLFDELAIDLGSLFDRRSPQALLFPRETSLLALLDLLDDADLQDLWAEDETIGWIYQYYNDPAERKKMREESAAPRNSRELAVRNQFFTPRYVVEFLTDNTLGRIWYEMTQGVTALKEQCRYLVRRPTEIFLKPGESAPEQPTQDGLSQEDLLKQPVFIAHRPLKDPRSILMLDPACGSMHFGLYAFDLFEAIYDEAWEIAAGSDAAANSGEDFAPFLAFAASFVDKAAFQREVPRMIVEHNLHGIDIDSRAAQIAGLSLWLRAQRAWHAASVKPVDRPRITRSNIVCAEPMPGDKVLLAEFVEQQFPEGERAAFGFLLETVFDRMTLAGEAGSLLKIEEEIRTAIAEAKKIWEKEPAFNQRMLFGGENAAEVTQKKLDLSGITDEQFWEGAEERIYDALRDYAEQAESGGFQRRLFAEDAARGFAFIDVCRKRYDAVVMNPPFGEFSLQFRDAAASKFVSGNMEILAAFIERGLELGAESGLLGAITSRTAFFQTTMAEWRQQIVMPSGVVCWLELGMGVLDAAMVETVMYVLGSTSSPSLFIGPKADTFLKSLSTGKEDHEQDRSIHLVETTNFKTIGGSPFAYWLSSHFFECIRELPTLEESGMSVRVGLQTGDDFRFVRAWWEVAATDLYSDATRSSRWVSHAKGGENSPFFVDVHLVVNWDDGGREISSHPSSVTRSSQFYLRPGLTFSYRTHRFSPAFLPRLCITGVAGMGVFIEQHDLSFAVAFLNSSLVNEFISARLGLLEINALYQAGTVSPTPFPPFSDQAKQSLSELGTAQFQRFRAAVCFDEASRSFSGFLTELCTLHAVAEMRVQAAEAKNSSLVEAYSDCDRLVLSEYGFVTADVEQVLCKGMSVFQRSIPQSLQNTEEVARELAAFLLGCAFGRWDIRYATGELAAPELPDPFAPLPVCPPGQLQNAQGLPARLEDVPAAYPVRVLWDGILVDDPNHPLDLERRVREVIEIIWTGKEGSATAEAIELEACKILGVKSLRDYFRKPACFFADHLKRYSKSRRQAPIYWPLSTKSGSYTLWIYYHRLNDQTLHKCLADFLDPKIKDVESELGKLTGKDSGRAADLRDFLNELKDLKDEIERVIKLPWKPNLNDGVLITASPLWKLFRLSKWQKDLKACWEELEKGDYDWAHLAYTIWPERVEKVFEKDRSIAIAHGLEDLCKIEPPKPKKPRGKKASS